MHSNKGEGCCIKSFDLDFGLDNGSKMLKCNGEHVPPVSICMTTEKRRNNSNRSSSPVYGTAIETLEELKAANFGSHYLVAYPNLDTLRDVYTSYVKTALYETNEGC